MSKPAQNRQFRKVDVDQYDEEKYVEQEDGSTDDTGPNEAEVNGFLNQYPSDFLFWRLTVLTTWLTLLLLTVDSDQTRWMSLSVISVTMSSVFLWPQALLPVYQLGIIAFISLSVTVHQVHLHTIYLSGCVQYYKKIVVGFRSWTSRQSYLESKPLKQLGYCKVISVCGDLCLRFWNKTMFVGITSASSGICRLAQVLLII